MNDVDRSLDAKLLAARRLYERYVNGPGGLLDMVAATEILGLLISAVEAFVAEHTDDGR